MLPKVSIGMPVYNGERYLGEALDSLLAQTFTDFELVIVDNASIDRTAELCRSYTRRDDRVRYVRNRANYGAIYNFNNVFRLTTGEYFKWAAYDDVCEPEFLSRCLEVLDEDPGVVLACPRVTGIDEDGHPTDIVTRPGHGQEVMSGIHLNLDPAVSPTDPDPVQRWRFMMRYLWWTPHLYGVIRASVLARTNLHPYHFNGDHILLAELALLGRFHEIPEDLFHVRLHAQRTSRTRSAAERLAVAHPGLARSPLFLPVREVLVYPERFLAHVASIKRAPLTGSQRLACYYELLAAVMRWARMRGGSVLQRIA
jgi:glycosyltransferase involved in cell wall biosynthesis